MRPFADWSLTRQVFVYLAVVGFVPLLLVAVPSYFSLSESFVERALADQRNLLESDRQHMVLIQEQVEALIDNISGVELVRAALDRSFEAITTYRQLAIEARVGSILNGYLNVRGIVSIHLFGRRGAHFRVGDTLDFDPQTAAHAAPLIEQARQSGSRIVWPGVERNMNHRSNSDLVLPAIKILYHIDRETLQRVETGAVVVNYSVDYLVEQFSGSDRSVSSSRFLLDQHDRVIARSSDAAGDDASIAPLLAGLAPGERNDVVAHDGQAFHRVWLPFERHGWKLLSITPRDAVLSGFVQLRNRTGIAMAFGLLVVAWIAMRFSRTVVAPVDRIAHSFRRLNEGADDVRPLPGGGSGEIGELSTLFNRFLEGLSERERANHKARESAVVFAVSSEGIMITDGDGVIKLVNPAFSRITGYAADEAVGRSASMLKSGRHDEAFYRMQWFHLRTADYWEGEIYNKRSNGEIYPGWQTISAVRDADGDVVEYVTMFADITARKHAEQEQARLQREASQSHKLQALGQLTGGIAHDFNNILGIIMGNAALGLKKYADEVDPKLASYLRTVMSASERARNLVAQMLTYNRREGGGTTHMQLAPVIAEHVDMLRSVIPSSITLTFDPDDDLPDVAIDAVGLQQMVMNLCLNARDAMNGAGTLMLRLELARLDDGECSACHRRLRGEWVALCVVDSGAGIDAPLLEHIFEPFFTTKDVGEGVGMGLAVVHGIIQRLDGHVVVESVPGRGTTFRILLPPAEPVDPPGTDAPPARVYAPVPVEGIRVLVVDDEPELAELTAEVLDGYGYACSVCTDSATALNRFTAMPGAFDVVLTDQTMPDMTGLELIERLRLVRPNVPVALVTGYSDSVDAPRARELGITYLLKPVAPPDLASAIAAAVTCTSPR